MLTFDDGPWPENTPAVHAVSGPVSPFFRFSALQHPPELLSYLAEPNIATFSTDIEPFDFKMRKPPQVIESVIHKLQKQGKGSILMHDFQHATAETLPDLRRQLKVGGYKVVHVVPRAPVATLAKYDEMVMQHDKLLVNIPARARPWCVQSVNRVHLRLLNGLIPDSNLVFLGAPTNIETCASAAK